MSVDIDASILLKFKGVDHDDAYRIVEEIMTEIQKRGDVTPVWSSFETVRDEDE
jgi:hypothetical protein